MKVYLQLIAFVVSCYFPVAARAESCSSLTNAGDQAVCFVKLAGEKDKSKLAGVRCRANAHSILAKSEREDAYKKCALIKEDSSPSVKSMRSKFGDIWPSSYPSSSYVKSNSSSDSLQDDSGKLESTFRYRSDGCEYPKRMFYVNKRVGFLWLKTKKVPIGCMTQADFNRWQIEQKNARRSSPTYIPTPTYQPKPVYYPQPQQPTYQPRTPRVVYPQNTGPRTCYGSQPDLYGTSMVTCY